VLGVHDQVYRGTCGIRGRNGSIVNPWPLSPNPSRSRLSFGKHWRAFLFTKGLRFGLSFLYPVVKVIPSRLLPSLRGGCLTLERRAYTALSRLAARKSSQPRHLLTGEQGEDAAYFHLRSLGYTIVARRWRSDRTPGDIDLIAWDGDTLVFLEIKTRTAHDLAAAESQIDPHKQKTLRRMAAAYLRQIPERHRDRVPVRFDVLSVYLLPTQTEFEHFRAAFAFSAPRF
jgi:putative endonuclease